MNCLYSEYLSGVMICVVYPRVRAWIKMNLVSVSEIRIQAPPLDFRILSDLGRSSGKGGDYRVSVFEMPTYR